MNLDFLTPDVFDALIIVNIVVGVVLAWRRFRRDINGPLPDDVPPSARDAFEPSQASAPPDRC